MNRIALPFLFCAVALHAASTSSLVHPDEHGRLTYTADKLGNTILDFSNCGYLGGGVALPAAVVKMTLDPQPAGDDTARIQKAIDAVSQLPPGADGIRGALLLRRGAYRIGSSVTVSASGVVLRGEGADEQNGTLLIGAGTTQRSLVNIGGGTAESDDEKAPAEKAKSGRTFTSAPIEITDDYVPVNARSFHVVNAQTLKPGDTVIVSRNGNDAWIHELGMDQIKPLNAGRTVAQWKPFSLDFDRVVTAVRDNIVSVDAPIACAIEKRWGGGSVRKFADMRIEKCGIEFLAAVSEFQTGNPNDEQHALRLVSFGAVKNSWGRGLTATHFYHGVALIGHESKWCALMDCRSLDPVSQITGGRRYPFAVEGQLALVQRCYSRNGRHAFVFGARVPGPNVFLDCRSEEDHATSEPHHRWSVGGLYDNCDAHINLVDREGMGSGHGWAGANYVAWNCSGELACEQPPTAQNYAIGFVGKKKQGPFKREDGFWESTGRHIEPRSLYLKQLEDRLGPQAAVIAQKAEGPK